MLSRIDPAAAFAFLELLGVGALAALPNQPLVGIVIIVAGILTTGGLVLARHRDNDGGDPVEHRLLPGSVGIYVEGGSGNKLLGNITSGFETGISAKNERDLEASDNLAIGPPSLARCSCGWSGPRDEFERHRAGR